MPPFLFLKINFNIFLLSNSGSSKWSLPLGTPNQTSQTFLPHPYVLHDPTNSFFLILSPENILWYIQNTKLLILLFFSIPCYLVPLRPKYSPQHPILNKPQPTFLPQCERLSFTPNKTKGKFRVLYDFIFIFFKGKLEDKILHWMIASLPSLHSALKFFLILNNSALTKEILQILI